MTPAIAAMFLIPYAIALVLFGADVLRPARAPLRIPTAGPSAFWVCAIVASYAAMLAIVREQALRTAVAMPIPVMNVATWHPDATAIAMLLCAAIQSYALLVLYRRGVSNAWLIAGIASSFALSFAVPALTSADVYSNAGYALLGARAYAPPSQPFGGEFAAINAWWGTPMVPAPYGPLWLLIDRVVTAPFSTLVGKVLALRALGAISLLALAWALHRLGLPARFAAVTLLNPALALHFIANAHNDVVATLAAVLAAIAVRSRRNAIATILLVAAATIKLPYAALGLPILATIRSKALRCALAAAIVAASLALSWFFGGAAYVGALFVHAQAMTAFGVWHVVAVAVALVVLLLAFAGGRRYRFATWLLAPIGAITPAFIYPWYLIWAVPYSLASRRVLGYVLVWLPFVATLINQQFVRVWTLVLLFPVLAALALYTPRAQRLPAARSRLGS